MARQSSGAALLTLVATVVAVALPPVTLAQDSRAVVQAIVDATDQRGPFPLHAVVNAPFTADAILTIIEQTTAGRRQWRTTRRVYRDSTGRARVDYEAPLPNGRTRMVAVILRDLEPQPGRMAYMVDPETRTIRRLPRDLMNGQFSGWSTFDIPIGLSNFRTFAIDFGATADVEPLGERRIEGLTATGWRLTGGADPSQPDERWESPDLKMVLRASFVDGRTHAAVDYRLTNIQRLEADARLFDIPADYTMGTTGPLIGQPGDPLYRSGGPLPK